MLFERPPDRISEDVALWLPEEPTTTPAALFEIGFFPAFAFLGMALLIDDKGVPIFVGAFLIGLMAIAGAWLEFQRRYGEAVLTAKSPFVYGRRFEGEDPVRLSDSGRRMDAQERHRARLRPDAHVADRLGSDVPDGMNFVV
jgi:hypothetical protein